MTEDDNADVDLAHICDMALARLYFYGIATEIRCNDRELTDDMFCYLSSRDMEVSPLFAKLGREPIVPMISCPTTGEPKIMVEALGGDIQLCIIEEIFYDGEDDDED